MKTESNQFTENTVCTLIFYTVVWIAWERYSITSVRFRKSANVSTGIQGTASLVLNGF
jgi:hypothetical protein